MKNNSVNDLKLYRTKDGSIIPNVGHVKLMKKMVAAGMMTGNIFATAIAPITVASMLLEPNTVEVAKTIIPMETEQIDMTEYLLTQGEVFQYQDKLATFFGITEAQVEQVKQEHRIELEQAANPSKKLFNYLYQAVNQKTIVADQTENVVQAGSDQKAIAAITAFKKEHPDIWAMYQTSGARYGVDPELLIARDYQESHLDHDNHIPGSANFSHNTAYGISQVEEALFGMTFHPIDYQLNDGKGAKVDVEFTRQGAMDLATNIEYGAIEFQINIHKFDYNIYMAEQGYNYGTTFDMLLKENNFFHKDAFQDLDNLSWIPNAVQTISNYGDPNYVYHVSKNFSVAVMKFKDKNDWIYINTKTNEFFHFNKDSLSEEAAQCLLSLEQDSVPQLSDEIYTLKK